MSPLLRGPAGTPSSSRWVCPLCGTHLPEPWNPGEPVKCTHADGSGCGADVVPRLVLIEGGEAKDRTE